MRNYPKNIADIIITKYKLNIDVPKIKKIEDKVNNIQNLSVLSNLDTESTCLLRNDKCTIVRVKTFCTQLNDYTG